jgi:hypothetical protein
MYSLVIIGTNQTAALRERLGADSTVVVFADSDSLQALDRILAAHPNVVALSGTFVETARGAGLVARLKGDAELSSIDVRVLTEDENRIPLVLSAPVASWESALLRMSRPLDRAGTRGALRYEMDRRPIVVNGERSTLIDLSITGAQVLLPIRVRPREPVRMVLAGQGGESRCSGTIVWSVAVPASGTMQYRAGVQLTNPNTQWLEDYCARFGGRPDQPSAHSRGG